MNSIEKLTEIFGHFPGIGPRQARRFVYYLLTRTNTAIDDLVKNISSLKSEVSQCSDCRRFFEKKHAKANLCGICSDEDRDRTMLMIVPRDIDLESVEKNGGYSGLYFVLGGTVSILEKEPEKRVRLNELKLLIKERANQICEIIIGTSFNPEGDNTADFIKRSIGDGIKISKLGRGLSTGTELEYTDPETFKNALKNRS